MAIPEGADVLIVSRDGRAGSEFAKSCQTSMRFKSVQVATDPAIGKVMLKEDKDITYIIVLDNGFNTLTRERALALWKN